MPSTDSDLMPSTFSGGSESTRAVSGSELRGRPRKYRGEETLDNLSLLWQAIPTNEAGGSDATGKIVHAKDQRNSTSQESLPSEQPGDRPQLPDLAQHGGGMPETGGSGRAELAAAGGDERRAAGAVALSGRGGGPQRATKARAGLEAGERGTEETACDPGAVVG